MLTSINAPPVKSMAGFNPHTKIEAKAVKTKTDEIKKYVDLNFIKSIIIVSL